MTRYIMPSVALNWSKTRNLGSLSLRVEHFPSLQYGSKVFNSVASCPKKRKESYRQLKRVLFSIVSFVVCSYVASFIIDFLNVFVFFQTLIFNSRLPLFSFPSLLLCSSAKQGCVTLFILNFLNSPACDMKFCECTFYSFQKVL